MFFPSVKRNYSRATCRENGLVNGYVNGRHANAGFLWIQGHIAANGENPGYACRRCRVLSLLAPTDINIHCLFRFVKFLTNALGLKRVAEICVVVVSELTL